MRFRRVLWTMAALAGLACAQPQSEEKVISKIIPVHYVDVGHLRELLVSIPGVIIKSDAGMGVLVASGRSDLVSAVEEMVKKLDVQPRDIEITAYLLSGSLQTAGDNLPAELSPVIKQLHALFPYKGYRMVESFVTRGREGRAASANGALPGTNSAYSFRYNTTAISGDATKTIRIDGLDLSITTPISGAFDKNGNPRLSYAGIRTDIDAAEGQKVVVGKSNVNGTADAMIMVVTAKVIQ